MEPLIIFVHIPKTGGTSLIRVLTQVYGRARTVRIQTGDNQGNHEAVRDILLNRPFDYDMISVHIGRGHLDFHTLPLQRPVVYFTVMRNPVEREISRYYYVRSHPKDAAHEEFMQYKNLADAVTKMSWNTMTRVLSGTPTDTDHDLQQAKRNLESLFLFPGILERLDESLLLLGNLLKWSRLYLMPPHLNVSKRNDEVTDAIRQQIAESCYLDMELYRFSLELLDRRIQEAGLSYRRDQLRVKTRLFVRQVKTLVRSRLGK